MSVIAVCLSFLRPLLHSCEDETSLSLSAVLYHHAMNINVPVKHWREYWRTIMRSYHCVCEQLLYKWTWLALLPQWIYFFAWNVWEQLAQVFYWLDVVPVMTVKASVKMMTCLCLAGVVYDDVLCVTCRRCLWWWRVVCHMQEVLLFPAMKPDVQKKKDETDTKKSDEQQQQQQ